MAGQNLPTLFHQRELLLQCILKLLPRLLDRCNDVQCTPPRSRAAFGTLPQFSFTGGLPVEGIALVAGIDRLFDMGRTTINITGDAACALIVSKMEDRKEARTRAVRG